MTILELLTAYANSAAGAFRNQVMKAIKPSTMRQFTTDLSTTFVPVQDSLRGVLAKDAVAAKNIEASGTYIHAGPGAIYTMADDVKEVRVTNDSSSTGLVTIKNSVDATIWVVDPGNTAYGYWDGDKHQWK